MLVIRNAAHVIQSAGRVLSGADVLVEGGLVAGVGVGLSAPGAREIDARGCIVAPGFHNLHTHLYQSFLKGMRDDLPLVEWCNEVTFPFVGAAQAAGEGKAGLFHTFGMLGAAEQLMGGITAFVDMDMAHSALCRAWQELGVRGTLAVQTANAWIPEHLRRADAEQLKSLERSFERAAVFELASTAIAPSTPFCCTPEYLHALGKMAESRQKRIYIHVSETRREVEESLQNTGMAPLKYLDSLGILNSRVTLVHCVHLTEEELGIAAARGVTVCHCPMSNLKLADGAAPIKALLERGVPVVLGTDGAASNDRLDMFSEMRCMLQIARHSAGRADALTAKDALYMATEAGARAMGLASGVLEPGRPADLMVVDAMAPNMAPCHDPVNTLVWCAGPENVKAVLVNGQVVLQGGSPTRVNMGGLVQRAMELDCMLHQAAAAANQAL